MEIKYIDGGVCAPQGFTAYGMHCGIRKNKTKSDLALLFSEASCSAAGVYTRNKVAGAPIVVTKKNLENGTAKAVICNSGNANTCNADGIEKAETTCAELAKALCISPDDVIVASTGVIGQPLPLEPIVTAIPALVSGLTNSSDLAAEAILTTDLVKKECSVSFTIGGKECRIGGMAKGSGMIHPNMATMLCFITSDVAISPELLQRSLSACVDDSFNMVSVDGDTSTNDMVTVMCNGEAGNKLIEKDGEDYEMFHNALMRICIQLCRMVAKDGEGASKLLECTVTGAPEKQSARNVAKTVITSSLFKAAMFGEDANWGRILCAVGYSDANYDIGEVAVTISSDYGSVNVCQNGSGVEFSEELAAQILKSDEIHVAISLGTGTGCATAWGCDLTYEYVKINGDYRT